LSALRPAALTLLLAAGLGPAPQGGGWRTDPAWYDGQAETCVYEATRTVYGLERRYRATAYTDKERASPETTTKTEGDDGVEVFKHHWSERVPTESYDYDYSTMSYTRASDLAPFKLTVATQDDCGASYKELWREGDGLRWFESVYFPDGGRREGRLAGEPVPFDALTLVLRDFPFDAPADRRLAVLPSQKSPRRVPFEPEARVARYGGRETLELPAGRVDARRVDLLRPDGSVEARFWFAADGGAPWLHALVRYEGPEGVTYRLVSLERTKYWERPQPARPDPSRGQGDAPGRAR
jgi:hypothetical protein